MGRTARLFLVDDHPVIRRGLIQLLAYEEDLEICGEAGDARSALGAVREQTPDLMIVDVSLGASNGIDLIKQMRAHDEKTKILVMSVHDESVYAERALHAGALGYVHKQAPGHEILRAIRTALAGEIYLSETASQLALQRMRSGRAPAEDPIEGLTDRELHVFELLGHGRTTREVAERLHLSVKTIESHREHIKQKLALRNGAELVQRAVRWVVEHQA